MTYSLSVSLRLFLQGQQSLDSGPTLIQYDLNLTSYIYKEPISKQGHILRFQVDMDLGGEDTVQIAALKLSDSGHVDLRLHHLKSVQENLSTFFAIKTV